MDMLRFHRFTIGWAWVTEYGSADSSAAQFQTLKAYSPLHNLKPGTDYPADPGDHGGPRRPGGPGAQLQVAAALQASDDVAAAGLQSGSRHRAGHGAGKPIAKVIEEEADVMAFALANMALAKAGAVAGTFPPAAAGKPRHAEPLLRFRLHGTSYFRKGFGLRGTSRPPLRPTTPGRIVEG